MRFVGLFGLMYSTEESFRLKVCVVLNLRYKMQFICVNSAITVILCLCKASFRNVEILCFNLRYILENANDLVKYLSNENFGIFEHYGGISQPGYFKC